MELTTTVAVSFVGGLTKLRGCTPGGGLPPGISDNGTPGGIEDAISTTEAQET